MTGYPADGERGAVRGYQWQYDHAAALVYDALLAGDFERLRLVDPTAGQVDDLVLFCSGRVDAYQFKSAEFPSSITFNQITRPEANQKPSTVKALAQAWQGLRVQWPDQDVQVHFVTQHYASTSDRLPVGDDSSPRHFSAFLKQVLNPLREGEIDPAGVDVRWQPVLTRLSEATGLTEQDFATFLSSLHLDVAAQSAIPDEHSQRSYDIVSLSTALHRRVAEATGVVELDTDGVLELTGWKERTRLRSWHKFPVDLDVYAPLTGGVDQLLAMLDKRDKGYIALVGPPGAGKSTLLSQALTGSADRVVRYYAYVPGTASQRTRMTAKAFLQDVVLMLSRSGLNATNYLLPNEDIDTLRRELHEHLDAASSNYSKTKRRTVIVVDGLDHVDREMHNDRDLLVELPKPDELPTGVVFIVGSRTLDPLGSQARSHVKSTDSVIDLGDHRLPHATILDICSRAPATARLPHSMHERLAELSDGHPLSLSYLINLVKGTDAESAKAALLGVRAYGQDIAAYYCDIWESLKDDDDLIEILSVCSRLRIGFKTQWLHTWTSPRAVRAFRRKLFHLFREHVGGLRFFHASFQEFAADRTALGDNGRPDGVEDAVAHRRVADLCARSANGDTAADNHAMAAEELYHRFRRAMAAEELYHRFRAGQHDKALQLARQEAFREQSSRFRSADLIRADIETGLSIAAESVDVVAMLRLMLALVELDERCRTLEEVDVAGLLYDVGLAEDAVAYYGDARGIRPEYAYGLAARLAESGDPTGRRIFDLIDPDGIACDNSTRQSGREIETAEAWARAALWYRPPDTVLKATRTLIANRTAGDDGRNSDRVEHWHRYQRVMRTLINVAADCSDRPTLKAISSALLGQNSRIRSEQANSGQEERETANDKPAATGFTQRMPFNRDKEHEISNNRLAVLTDLHVRSLSALISLADTAEDKQRYLEILSSSLQDAPLFRKTLLNLAELFAENGRTDESQRFLSGVDYDKALTYSDFGYRGDSDLINRRFRYWRLRYLLATSEDPAPAPVPPNPETPAGDDIDSSAPVHSDAEVLETVAQIDSSIHALARIKAAAESGRPITAGEVWTEMVPTIYTARRSIYGNSSLLGIVRKNSELMLLAADIAISFGGRLPQRMVDTLNDLFEQQPLYQWPMRLRLYLANSFLAAGVPVPWHQDTLDAIVAYAAAEDVDSRLDTMARAARGFKAYGRTDRAREIALGVVQAAFGVGDRQDYQFRYWVLWLKRALAEPDGQRFVEDAQWLARLLAAVSEATHPEGTPDLPAAVVPADPIAAVRIFEYLVREGAVFHTDALAALLESLLSHTADLDMPTIVLVADITAEMLAPAANSAYPKLAESLKTATEQAAGVEQAATLAESVVQRTDIYALHTARASWRGGLGLGSGAEDAGAPDELLSSSQRSAAEKDKQQLSYPNILGSLSSSQRSAAKRSTGETLVLRDGRRLTRSEVVEQIRCVADIVDLRCGQSSDSSFFRWSRIISQQTLTDRDATYLEQAFNGHTSADAEVLVYLAEWAHDIGDHTRALRLASKLLELAPKREWHYRDRSVFHRAAAIAARLGQRDEHAAACQSFARYAASLTSVHQLFSEMQDIAEALGPELNASDTWPAVRCYLKGMAETLDLGSLEDLADHGCRWWLAQSTANPRLPDCASTPRQALAELAVRHISHPTWIFRESAAAIVARSLRTGNIRTAEALNRFTQAADTDETLESAGRCLTAAANTDTDHVLLTPLRQLDRRLSEHPSQVLRDLASREIPRAYQPLRQAYRLTVQLPEPLSVSKAAFLSPHEYQYAILADALGIDLGTILAVAARYATEALERLPEQEEVKSALAAAGMKHTYPSVSCEASRSAFGRVLADLADARLLDNLPESVLHELRTIDADTLTRTPTSRPSVVPQPPETGHGLTIEQWRADTENRIDEYTSAAHGHNGEVLIAADSRLAVLQHNSLHEELECGTTFGTTPPNDLFIRRHTATLKDLSVPVSPRTPDPEEPLVVQNTGYPFHQHYRASWLAFRPALAAALKWTPDPSTPGRWHTATGDLTVESLWWVDGWWTRGTTSSYDTDAEGHAVILTPAGLNDISTKFGRTTTSWKLTRHENSEAETDQTVATRTHMLIDPK